VSQHRACQQADGRSAAEIESGWWKAESTSGIGWIPRHFVELLTAEAQDSETPKYQQKMAIKQDPSVMKQGYLIKRGHVRKNWKMRFFVLRNDSLSYYETQYTNHGPLGVISLKDFHSITVNKVEETEMKLKKRNVFRLAAVGKEYYIDAQTEDELNSWIVAMRSVLQDGRRPV